ncbi:MAG: hypothetical protein FWG77_04240 [Treponema sp.]|nr:hypothetical protein [Treponema sp.]
MRKVLVLALVFVLAGAGSLFAIDIRFEAPEFEGGDSADLNREIKAEFDAFEREIRDELAGFDYNPERIVWAFANSSIFASHGATQRGYGGFNTFGFSIGPMLGFQLPGSPLNLIDNIDQLEEMLFDGDIAFGANVQFLNAQFSLNTSRFLLDNLYLGLRFGYLNVPIDIFSFNTLMAGVMANYQILNRRDLGLGLIQWRGVNVGAGFVYQNTSIDIRVPTEIMDEEATEYWDYGGDRPIRVDLDFDLGLNFTINTFTVPVEVMTSVRLLYFLNLAVGAGVDIGFGNANLKLGGDMTANFSDLPDGMVQDRPARMTMDLGGSSAPTTFNPKIMTGVGIGVGPVVLDIPFTFYPLDQGYNFGISIGVYF